MKIVLILKREPATWLGLVAACVQFVSAFLFHLTVDQQSGLNAAAAGIVGVVVAFLVHDGVIAAITAGFQALIACGMGFGLGWSPDKQTAFMLIVVAISAVFVRSQVAAPVTASELRRGLRLAA